MWMKWLPWRFMIRHFACSHGFLDPMTLMAKLARFSQPSEVLIPLTLLKSGSVFHARGLINSQAIQHNLDWIWPYWIERQFDPRDTSFIPRAFSLTHINLTHRNWTAIGLPDIPQMPLIDPRGLVTPHFDGWSLDAWILHEDGTSLTPSTLPSVQQCLEMDGSLEVTTTSTKNLDTLESRVRVVRDKKSLCCRVHFLAMAGSDAWLVLSARPYNPEGISFIPKIQKLKNNRGWMINDHEPVYFQEPAQMYKFSEYREGDVFRKIFERPDKEGICDHVGMATAAALFKLHCRQGRQITIDIPLSTPKASVPTGQSWPDALRGASKLSIKDKKAQFVFESALRTVLLHAQKTGVYAGPFTYKMFWFRDMAFITHALVCLGLSQRAKAIIDASLVHQTAQGYFSSQDGEWDSNGEVLWLLSQFCLLTNTRPGENWRHAIEKGGHWIQKKLLAEKTGSPHAGLFPAGFSAEHLGPNDFYYWDDFWGAAGLQAASRLMILYGDGEKSLAFQKSAQKLMNAIERSLLFAQKGLGCRAMPASVYRRLDSGSIGSLAAGYPLKLWGPRDPRLLETCDYLYEHCLVDGGFFHDMSHSGINPYLTLSIAQVFLRAGDLRFLKLLRAIQDLASPTGQWPEAIHPATKGGCMGDGEHAWAAAEWLLFIRNSFVREEGGGLVLCSGVTQAWYNQSQGASFGPTATAFGPISVTIVSDQNTINVRWEGRWHGPAPSITVSLPGFPAIPSENNQTSLEIQQSLKEQKALAR
ncbi:MAG: hypothetical protein WC732_03880 [Candidatus Omnitrophota bacterium]